MEKFHGRRCTQKEGHGSVLIARHFESSYKIKNFEKKLGKD